MPRYAYECESCEKIIEVAHSIKERLERCDCEGILRRLPSIPIVLNKTSDDAAGTRVERFIKDARQELEQEKETLGKEKVE